MLIWWVKKDIEYEDLIMMSLISYLFNLKMIVITELKENSKKFLSITLKFLQWSNQKWIWYGHRLWDFLCGDQIKNGFDAVITYILVLYYLKRSFAMTKNEKRGFRVSEFKIFAMIKQEEDFNIIIIIKNKGKERVAKKRVATLCTTSEKGDDILVRSGSNDALLCWDFEVERLLFYIRPSYYMYEKS